MIHRIKEGDRMRWGLNIGPGYVGLQLHRRFQLWLDPAGQHLVSWFADLTVDHRMYRPYDVDSQHYFYCRRCKRSVYEADNFCSGKTYRRWR